MEYAQAFFSAVRVLIDSNFQIINRLRFWCLMYGLFLSPLMEVFGNADVWCKVHILLDSESEDIDEFRKSQSEQCNMTALAGTIVSLVAVTSLLLPSLDETHWVARALWIFSLLLGCFAVYYASNMHRALGKLLRAEEVKKWMTNTSKSNDEWKTPCLLAVLLISCSKQLLDYSLIAYVTGLGVYLGFLWQTQLDKGTGDNNDSRNVFIVYVISVVLCLGYSQIGNWKDLDCSPWEKYLNSMERIPGEQGFRKKGELRPQLGEQSIHGARLQEWAKGQPVQEQKESVVGTFQNV